MLQGYAVTAVARLYWSWTISNFSTKKAPSEKKPGPDGSTAMKRLMGYMKPYLGRFVAVLVLVVLSSCGALENGVLYICCIKVLSVTADAVDSLSRRFVSFASSNISNVAV